MQAQGRLLTLDAMRGVAAILVVLYHLGDVTSRVASGGYLAVDFFFALSGLVLAQAYSEPLQRGLSVKDFMIKRIIRLYPLFMIGLCLAATKAVGQLVTGDANALSASRVVASFVTESFMLPSPFGGEDLFPLNGPAWSLFFEMVINLALALLLVRLRTPGLWIVAVLAGSCVVFAAITFGSLNVGWSWPTSWSGLARVAFAFTIGVIFHRMKLRPRVEGWYFVVPIILLVATLIFPVSRHWRPLFDCIAVLIAAPTLLAIGLTIQPPPWLKRQCEILGDLSYPLYAVHFPLLFMAGFFFRKLNLPPALWVPVFLVGLLIFAWMLGRYVDPPLRSLLTRIYTRRATNPQLQANTPNEQEDSSAA